MRGIAGWVRPAFEGFGRISAERDCVEFDEISRSDGTKSAESEKPQRDSEKAFALDELVERLLTRDPWLWR